MADAYIYCADLYCEDCARAIKADRQSAAFQGTRFLPSDPNDESSYDSDDYPKGPYDDGGGESDGPQCCGGCGEFLENPLTGDGYRYLLEMLAQYIPPNYSQILEESGAYEISIIVRDRILEDARAIEESPDLFERDPTRRKHKLDSLATVAQWADYYPEAFENLEESTV